jgi:esterase/lipase superfamily enzyme
MPKRTRSNAEPHPAWFLAGCLAWGTMAHASDLIYVLDVSAAMQPACGDAQTRLARARAWIGADAAGVKEKISVIAMGDRARLVLAPSAEPQHLASALGLLDTEQAASAPVPLALELVQAELFAKSITAPRVVLVTAAAQPTGDAVQAILALRTQGARFEWIGAGVTPAVDRLAGLGFGRVYTLGCDAAMAADQALVEAVRVVAAERAGLAPSAVPSTADLIGDLGLDTEGAFDVLARVCDAQGVPLPEHGDLTGISDIARYLANAPRKLGGLTRGGAAKAQTLPKPVYIQTVYFGTDRAPEGTPEDGIYFGGGRAREGQTSYGACHVSIPVQVHEHGKVESPFLGLRTFSDDKKHILLRNVTLLDRATFFDQLRKQLAQDAAGDAWSQDILIFVHGFNVPFTEAARRTAQVAYDVGFTGAPVMFSWPSDGKLYAYISDREDVEWSIPHLEQFLADLSSQAQPRGIHLITHSMGTEGALRALHNMALRRGPGDAKPLLENVILAAPDFDAVIFADQIAPQVRALARHWTLYASDKDTALNVSASLRSAPRLGIPIPLVEGVDTIDATGIEVTPWSVPEFHSYFATKQRVIADLSSALKGLSPASRDLEARSLDSKTYWRLAPPGSHGSD